VRLRIATCTTLPEVDVDEEPLARAVAAAGIDATLVAWDDPHADWDAPIPTLLRSTWNYALAIDDFLAWVSRVSAIAPLWNPPEVVRTNVHKRYLLELAARGVPVIPTTLVPRGEMDLAAVDTDRFVIKPEVGAGSLDTRTFRRGDVDAIEHLTMITARGAALVQPYVVSVEDYGERSMIWIDGDLTHSIRKSPRFSGDDERIDGPFPIADDERVVAEAALAPYVDKILYGRVDLARDGAGNPMVMELELVEPSLFFARHPPSLDRFVDALVRELRRESR
jgi:glutathione synthase/RimK-type ligase-like ATP-grasp enzyme